MPTFFRLAFILLTLAMCFAVQASAADSGAKVATIAGLIDRLDADNSRIVVKTIASDPSKVKTAVINIDKTSIITIDKMTATYDDLMAGDKVVVKYCQGVATSVVVTRVSSNKTAPPAAKP